MNPETYRLADEDLIPSPALIYYRNIIETNIGEMVDIAKGVERLWPHVKTHKCARLIELMMQNGIFRFKCATIAEAEMIGMCGARQSLVAYPLVGPNITRYVRLVQSYPDTEYFAIGDNEGQLKLLSQEAVVRGVCVNLLLDINDGLNRTGIETEKAGQLYRKMAKMPNINMRGMHVYDGHRHERELGQRQANVDADLTAVFQLRDELVRENTNCDIMVMGGTPSFPCHAQYKDVFLSPGTCLLQDYNYASLFPDLPFQVAAILLTRVISHPADGLFTVDLGTKSVASDPMVPRAVIFGFEEAETVKQNEEHWVLRMPEGRENDRPAVGTVLYAVPKHICPTSALYASILVAQNGHITDEWRVTARDRLLSV